MLLNSTNLTKLRNLHPPKSGTPAVPNEVRDFVHDREIILDIEDVRKIIRSAPNGKAVGASGVRYEHLKGFLSSQPALEDLTKFLNDFCNAKVPKEFFEIIGNSDLIAIPKDQDGGIRPIALIELMRSIGSKLVLKACTEDILRPHRAHLPSPNGRNLPRKLCRFGAGRCTR